MDAQLMKQMDDDHLVAALRAEFDPLTGTAVEAELLDRFEALLAETDRHGALIQLEEDFEIDATDMRGICESHPGSLKDMAELLAELNDRDIHTVEQLQAALKAADEIADIADEAGDIFTRLSQLITTAQEQ